MVGPFFLFKQKPEPTCINRTGGVKAVFLTVMLLQVLVSSTCCGLTVSQFFLCSPSNWM